jgi:hypothetical protein
MGLTLQLHNSSVFVTTMADTPPKAGGKVSPKKETVRISLPPKPSAKETVRLTLPPKVAAGAAPPTGAAPAAAPPSAGAPPAAKQTVRLQLPPKPAAGAVPAPSAAPGGAAGAKQTVRLQLPPKPAGGGAAPGGAAGAKQTVRLNLPPKPSGGAAPAKPKSLKSLVPQTDTGAPSSAEIPDHDDAEMPTMDSSAPPAKPAPPGGLRGGPPGSRPPAAATTDSTPSAVSLPAKKAPKPAMGAKLPMAAAPAKAGSSVGVVDIILAVFAMGAGIAAAVFVFLLKNL